MNPPASPTAKPTVAARLRHAVAEVGERPARRKTCRDPAMMSRIGGDYSKSRARKRVEIAGCAGDLATWLEYDAHARPIAAERDDPEPPLFQDHDADVPFVVARSRLHPSKCEKTASVRSSRGVFDLRAGTPRGQRVATGRVDDDLAPKLFLGASGIAATTPMTRSPFLTSIRDRPPLPHFGAELGGVIEQH